MAVAGLVELTEALRKQDYDTIKGTPESSWIDFKSAVYGVDPSAKLKLSDRGKWELCKDVASFANATGGAIVIGIKEEKDPSQGIAVAGPPSPIAVSTVDLAHYKDVVSNGIYPQPAVEFQWFADGNPAKGALLINVRGRSGGYHVLRRMVSDDGDLVESFGIPYRNDDRTNWFTAEKVHHQLEDGNSSGTPSTAPAPSPKLDKDRAKSIRNDLISEHGWGDSAVWVLQAVPKQTQPRLTDFYDDIRQQLSQPPRIRPMGFDLTSLGGAVDVVAGSFVVAGARDTIARLEQDGLFTVIVRASPNFLGWALNEEDEPEVMNVNATVLTEMTLSFCLFVDSVLSPRGLSAWTYVTECRNFKRENVRLAPYKPGRSAGSDIQKASTDSWTKFVEPTSEPAKDAFSILAEVYALYGMSDKVIPYSVDQMVQDSQLQDLNKNPW